MAAGTNIVAIVLGKIGGFQSIFGDPLRAIFTFLLVKCIYKFACGRKITANCQFIEYCDTSNRSLQTICDIRPRDSAKSISICPNPKCKQNFCRYKPKIESPFYVYTF